MGEGSPLAARFPLDTGNHPASRLTSRCQAAAAAAISQTALAVAQYQSETDIDEVRGVGIGWLQHTLA